MLAIEQVNEIKENEDLKLCIEEKVKYIDTEKRNKIYF